jgi:hypothetical protein
MLLSGLDEIDLTLTLTRELEEFRERDLVDRRWAYRT